MFCEHRFCDVDNSKNCTLIRLVGSRWYHRCTRGSPEMESVYKYNRTPSTLHNEIAIENICLFLSGSPRADGWASHIKVEEIFGLYNVRATCLSSSYALLSNLFPHGKHDWYWGLEAGERGCACVQDWVYLLFTHWSWYALQYSYYWRFSLQYWANLSSRAVTRW